MTITLETTADEIVIARPGSLDKLRECADQVVECQFYKEKPGASGGYYILDEKKLLLFLGVNSLGSGGTLYAHFLYPSSQIEGVKQITRLGVQFADLTLKERVIQEKKSDFSRNGKGEVIWCSTPMCRGKDYEGALIKLITARLVKDQ